MGGDGAFGSNRHTDALTSLFFHTLNPGRGPLLCQSFGRMFALLSTEADGHIVGIDGRNLSRVGGFGAG